MIVRSAILGILFLSFNLEAFAGIGSIRQYHQRHQQIANPSQTTTPQRGDRLHVEVDRNRDGEVVSRRVYRIPDLRDRNTAQYFANRVSATGENFIVVKPGVSAMAVYDAAGQLIKTSTATAGGNWCKDIQRPCRTTAGTFKIYRKGGADCKSSKYPLGKGGAPMGYCMFFNGGQAIHASDKVVDYPASHGCVRLYPEVAEWLSKEVAKKGTQVIVLPYADKSIPNAFAQVDET